MQRPMGVTILAILAAVGGVIGLLAAFVLLAGGVAVAGALSGALGGLVFLFGLLALIVALLYLGFAYGAWTLRPWAWTLGMAGAILSLVSSALTILATGDLTRDLVGIIIAVVVVYYLNTPDVRRAFGRS